MKSNRGAGERRAGWERTAQHRQQTQQSERAKRDGERCEMGWRERENREGGTSATAGNDGLPQQALTGLTVRGVVERVNSSKKQTNERLATEFAGGSIPHHAQLRQVLLLGDRLAIARLRKVF